MSLDSSCFKDIPEHFEVDLGESLAARTEVLSTFRELGPPDLCHVVKTSSAAKTELGSYHLVSGVDASSSASLAAYINSLSYSLEDTSGWFGTRGAPSWKIKNGCYCCFNAFSRVDVRVDVKIPGGVNAYVIDLRGERHEVPADSEIWQETYVSAILRSILLADSFEEGITKAECWRKLDPITSLEGEVRFLKAVEGLFHKGWQVGSDPEIQVATVVSNHLTNGVMRYFGDSGRYQRAANLFERLVRTDPEVASLLARSYIGMNEEVKAIQILSQALITSNGPERGYPRPQTHSYTLLHTQISFLLSKCSAHSIPSSLPAPIAFVSPPTSNANAQPGSLPSTDVLSRDGKLLNQALLLAKHAVSLAPSEFTTWESLTTLYILSQQYPSALLTLNSCPMFTYNPPDTHRVLTPSRTSSPFHRPPYYRPIAEILPPKERGEDDEADPALLRLPSVGLRGTWKRAYNLLTDLVSKVGWDELLRIRSEVFVMEEEYRMQKAHVGAATGAEQQPSAPTNGVIHEDGTVDDGASTRGIKDKSSPYMNRRPSLSESSPASPSATDPDAEEEVSEPTQSEVDEALASAIPSIKISSPDEEKGEESKWKGEAEGLEKPELAADITDEPVSPIASPRPDANGPPPTEANGNVNGTDEASQHQFSFTNKRLCERWLDNLFMVLYEDLRVYTIFRAEMAHFKTQHVAYRKTSAEWEILGELCCRLKKREEGKECFQRALEGTRYSPRPWLRLMDMYAEEGDIQRVIQTAIRVAAYQYAEYTEMTYPTQIARAFFRLGQIHGHAKISFTLLSMGLPDSILKIMESYLGYGRVFKVEGYDF